MFKLGNLFESIKISLYGGRLSKDAYDLRLSQAQEVMSKFDEKVDRVTNFNKNYLPEVGITDAAQEALDKLMKHYDMQVKKRAEIIARRAEHEMITEGDVTIATAETRFGKKFYKILYFGD